MRLFDGASYVDGGGRDFRPMKFRAEGGCFFKSVSSLAFGGRCSSVGIAERYALPLRAAMVRNTILKMEQFVKVKECFRDTLFYDAYVSGAVFSSWAGTVKDGVLSPGQARVTLLWTIRLLI